MSDTSKLANSIWPNGMDVDSEGYAVFTVLGENKIDIPTNSPQWPKGDKLVSPFIYKNDKLVGFCDTKAMINDGNTIITMPYEHIEIDLSSIDKDTLQIHAPKAITKKVSWSDGKQVDIDDVDYKYKGCKTDKEVLAKGIDQYGNLADIASDGSWTELLSDLVDGNTNVQDYYGGLFYRCTALTSFKSDLSSLTDGGWMFCHCENLKSFDADLSSLTNGTDMFYYCTALTTFDSDLSSLTNGDYMFSNSKISSFESELPNLTDGPGMFDCCYNLTTFTSDLSSLTDGGWMFRGCRKLKSFNCDNLSSLTNGFEMFYECVALTTFTDGLSSLTNGDNMFRGCKLDTQSIKNIADTINNLNGIGCCDSQEIIHIGIGNTTPNAEEITAFNRMSDKGWTVFVNGSEYVSKSTPNDGSNPASMFDESQNSPIPFYAKPVQTDEKNGRYMDSEGNYFNILGGQFIYGDDISTYGMFINEEDAAAQMSLTPYTKPLN